MNLIIIVTSDSFPIFGVTAAQFGGCFPEWTRWISSRTFSFCSCVVRTVRSHHLDVVLVSQHSWLSAPCPGSPASDL